MWKSRLLSFVRIITSVIVALFPLLILLVSGSDSFRWYLGIASIIFLAQCLFSLKRKSVLNVSVLSGVFGLLLGLISLLLDKIQVFLWYPVLINLSLFFIFSSSLMQGPPIIERFARLLNPDLPSSAIAYTRKVTILWCCFFVLNGSIATWTVVDNNLYLWSLWNGCLSYICIGALLVGETAYRKLVLHV